MAQVFGCPECQQDFQVPDDAAGMTFQCPACETNVQIPSDQDALTQNSEGVPAQIFACPHCEGQFGVTDEMFGTELECPHCQELVSVEVPSDSQLSPPNFKTDSDSAENAEFDSKSVSQGKKGASKSKKRSAKWRLDDSGHQPSGADTERENPNSVQLGDLREAQSIAKPESKSAKVETNVPPEPSVFQPKPINHLLPPRFDVPDPVRFPSSLKSGMVLLPDGSGGFQEADSLTVTLSHEGKIYRLKKMTPEQRRRRKVIHSTLAIAVALLLIYLTLQTLGLNPF